MTGQLSLDSLTVDPLADAIAWKSENSEAYAQVVEWANDDYIAGTRPAIDLYFNLLRRPHFARKLGVHRMDAVVLVNNNLRSQVARLIAREFPHLGDRRRGFEFRKSTSDSWTGVAR